jgi:hypothetical protein
MHRHSTADAPIRQGKHRGRIPDCAVTLIVNPLNFVTGV